MDSRAFRMVHPKNRTAKCQQNTKSLLSFLFREVKALCRNATKQDLSCRAKDQGITPKTGINPNPTWGKAERFLYFRAKLGKRHYRFKDQYLVQNLGRLEFSTLRIFQKSHDHCFQLRPPAQEKINQEISQTLNALLVELVFGSFPVEPLAVS